MTARRNSSWRRSSSRLRRPKLTASTDGSMSLRRLDARRTRWRSTCWPCDYIAETSPDSAHRIARLIVDGIASLHTFPNRGRPGRVNGTGEFVFAPPPFVAVYEVRDEVHVLRILHGAQRWPPQ
jgi:plasmid stabilization system protein ParE